jgi:hypothetical protein
LENFMIRARFAATALAVAVLPVTLMTVAPAEAAASRPALLGLDCQAGPALGQGTVCLFTGTDETGTEFDITVPITSELPLPGPATCVDVPASEGLTGSVENDTDDNLYVYAGPCSSSQAGIQPSLTIPDETTENLPAAAFKASAATTVHSIRQCTYGLLFDANRLTCDLAHLVDPG